MKPLIGVLWIVMGVWVLSPTPEADAAPSARGAERGWGHQGRPFGAPELDPGAAGSAMVLLLGGVAYIASRRREEGPA